MKVFEFRENANLYSVPFDWDNDDNIAYIDNVIENYFDKGMRVGRQWSPPFFGVVNKLQKVGDLGTLSGSETVIFSEKAVDVLMPLIKDSVELLSYPTEIGTYHLINVLDKGNYLDRLRTDCDEILSNGNCYGINRYAFDEQALQGKHIFRIPDDGVTRYVSGEFIETCKRHNLQGIYLTDKVKLWESEQQ